MHSYTIRQYRAQYNTPYVPIVTRVVPRRQRGLCVIDNIPLVQPLLAVALASVIRKAVVAIGQMRASSRGREIKAQKMFDCIISDDFRTRFA